METLGVVLTIKKGMTILLVLYKGPQIVNMDLEEQICRDIAESCKKNRIVILEDFNFPNIDGGCIAPKVWNLSNVFR